MSSTAKKIIILAGSAAILLAVLLIILFTCGNNDRPDNPADSGSESDSIGGLPTPEDSDSESLPADSDPVTPPASSESDSASEPSDSETPPASVDSGSQPSTDSEPSDTPATPDTDPSNDSESSSSTVKPGDIIEPTIIENFKHKVDTIYITKNNVQTRTSAIVSEFTEHVVVHYGESYERIAVSENWSCIFVDGYVCYVMNDHISTEEPAESETPETEPETEPETGDPVTPPETGDPVTPPDVPSVPGEFVEDNTLYYVKLFAVNVREAPNTSSAVIGHLAMGDTVQAIASDGEWVRFSFKNRVCYVKIESATYGTILVTSYVAPYEPSTPSTPEQPEDTAPETEEQPSK